GDPLAADGDALPRRVHFGAQGGNPAVHPDHAQLDERFRGAARGHSGPRQRTLQPHFGHWSAATYASGSAGATGSGVGGWSAMASSSARGRFWRSWSPSSSRKSGVVP